jgi:hypothetical protein
VTRATPRARLVTSRSLILSEKAAVTREEAVNAFAASWRRRDATSP